MFFLRNHVENDTGRLFPDFFSFFKKALYEVGASGLHRIFNIFRHTVKTSSKKR